MRRTATRRTPPARSARVAALGADAVIDMICFTPSRPSSWWTRCGRPVRCCCTAARSGCTARRAGAGHRGRAAHRYGEYGIGKAAIEELLRARRSPAASERRAAPRAHHRAGLAGHQPGRQPRPGRLARLAAGEPLTLPDLGLGVLHHVHADDVAQAFERALTRPAAIGSSFHVVAEQAMTLRGLAAGVAAWFGREPVLEYVDWKEYERRVGEEHAARRRASTSAARSRPASPGARAVLGCAPLFRTGSAARCGVRGCAGSGVARSRR